MHWPTVVFIIWTLFIFFHDPCWTWCKEQLAQGCLMEYHSLHHAYLQTHTAVGLEGAMEAGWANRARGSQRNPGKNRDKEMLSRRDPHKFFPQMAQQSTHTLPQPANYMLHLALHILSPPMPTLLKGEICFKWNNTSPFSLLPICVNSAVQCAHCL